MNAPIRMTLLALVIAVVAGASVAGLSQLTAVSVVDPRPSVPPAPTPTPRATPTATPSPSVSPAAPTSTPETQSGGNVWLYTIGEGDSLSGIAIRFGTTTEQLLAMNPEYAENQDLVEAGLEMIMPCTPIAAAEDRC